MVQNNAFFFHGIEEENEKKLVAALSRGRVMVGEWTRTILTGG